MLNIVSSLMMKYLKKLLSISSVKTDNIKHYILELESKINGLEQTSLF